MDSQLIEDIDYDDLPESSNSSSDIIKNLDNITSSDSFDNNNIKKSIGRPTKNVKAKQTDKIKCDICNKIYTRGNVTGHKKTKYHNLYKNVLNSIKNNILGYEYSKNLDDIVRKEYKTINGDILYMTNGQYNFYKSLPKNNLI